MDKRRNNISHAKHLQFKVSLGTFIIEKESTDSLVWGFCKTLKTRKI